MPKSKFSTLGLRICEPISLSAYSGVMSEAEALDELGEEMTAFLFPDLYRATMCQEDFCQSVATACVILAEHVPLKIVEPYASHMKKLFECNEVTQELAWLYDFILCGHFDHDAEWMEFEQPTIKIRRLLLHLRAAVGHDVSVHVQDILQQAC